MGGTRRGVKCLHAHYAWYLVGGDDPVGRWVAEQLAPVNYPGNEPVANVAAVDCGTLSTRLLMSGPTGEPILRV